MFRNHKSFPSYKGKPQFDGSLNQLNSKAIEELQKGFAFLSRSANFGDYAKRSNCPFLCRFGISRVECIHIVASTMNYRLSPGSRLWAESCLGNDNRKQCHPSTHSNGYCHIFMSGVDGEKEQGWLGGSFVTKQPKLFFFFVHFLSQLLLFFPLLARVRPPNKRPFAALLTHPHPPHGQSLRDEISFLQKHNFLNISGHSQHNCGTLVPHQNCLIYKRQNNICEESIL